MLVWAMVIVLSFFYPPYILLLTMRCLHKVGRGRKTNYQSDHIGNNV